MRSLILALSVGLLLVLSIEASRKQREEEANANWWRTEVFYQIYPRSFKDSDGDGIGDLVGITSKLEYLVETGITAIWLSPIFKSPMKDFGYDISNYTEIQSEYGTLEEFDALIAKAKELGIKVILDFVPNHTSDQHPWFAKSVARESGYEDFYVWEDGTTADDGTHVPPNNWISVFTGSAWEWHEDRQQFYLRQFTKAQPDLNYRNPAVLQAMKDVMEFWLERGIAGFRIDALNYVYENASLPDEPVSGNTDDTNAYEYLNHIYTKNLPEVLTLLQAWRKNLDEYTAANGGPVRIMMTESYADLTVLMDYYEDENGVKGAEFPFNFDFIQQLNENSTARDFVYIIQRWLTYLPRGSVANWVFSNHDNPRVASRFGAKTVDSMNMLLLTLPGIGVTYYGDELGMVDYRDISWEDTVDQPACDAGKENYKWVSRDPERTPMQWSNESFAGFSSAASWLPVNPNYKKLNLLAQREAKRSHYKNYQDLLELRKEQVLQEGQFIAEVFNRAVFVFRRELKGERSIVTLINVGGSTQQVDLTDFIDLPNRLVVRVAGVDSQYRVGQRLRPEKITLGPYEGLVTRLTVREG